MLCKASSNTKPIERFESNEGNIYIQLESGSNIFRFQSYFEPSEAI